MTTLFDPITAGELRLANRIAMAPLTRNRAPDAVPTPMAATYYAQRASAGLLITEATAISQQGQGYADVPGLYAPEQIAGWKRVTEAVHAAGGRIVTQLWHVGRVSHHSLQPGGGAPVAPSAITARTKTYLIDPDGSGGFVPTSEPRALALDELPGIVEDYRRAARAAIEAGFDGIEVHAANGYLIDQFLRSGSNQRTDAYGGSVEDRLRFPIEVFEAMRAAWPEHKPMSVRISATDWCDDGLTPEDSIAIAQAFEQAGADLIDVSAGQTTPNARPVYGRMFQTPFCDRIRNQGRVRTMAVGNIYEPDHVNSILAAGRADLCALARPHLVDPFSTLRAAAELGYDGVRAPVQYDAGERQLRRNAARREQITEKV